MFDAEAMYSCNAGSKNQQSHMKALGAGNSGKWRPKNAGALRIDHAMGLRRLFLIPPGARPESGAYVSYPFEDLLGILTLESQRNRCVVIGEDLGTIPEGFRHMMGTAGALSYRVFYFEKEGDRFKRPDEYPELALACATTHDLPTIAGFWAGLDIEHRTDLGLLPSDSTAEKLLHERALDRMRLHDRLVDEGLLDPGSPASPAALREAVHRFISRTRSTLAMFQAEDVAGELEQANLPGTTGERHPNWRRKLPLPLEAFPEDPRWLALARALRDERGER